MSEFASVFDFDSEALVSYSVEEDDGYASRASFDSPTKADEDDSSDYVNLFGNFKMDVESFDPTFCNLLFQNVGPENQRFNVGTNFKDENVCFNEQWDFLDDPLDDKEKMEPWHSVECLSPEESLPGLSLFASEFLELADSCDNASAKLNIPVLSCQSVVPEYRRSDEVSAFQNHRNHPSVSPVSVFKDHHKPSVGSCRVLPNVSLKISDSAASDAGNVGDHFPSFVMVADIGYVGALSCPVTPPGRRSGSVTPQHLSSHHDSGSKSATIDQNKLPKRAYNRKRRCSAHLDHDYLELEAYPKWVQASLIESKGCNGKERKTSNKLAASVRLGGKMRRNYKNSKISPDVTASMTDSSWNVSKDCQYVTLPGRHQSDFVYFAEKKPRMSKRRNSRTFTQ